MRQGAKSREIPHNAAQTTAKNDPRRFESDGARFLRKNPHREEPPLFFAHLRIYIRENRSGYIMPDAEYGSRHRGKGKRWERACRQAGGKSGILHPDLDRNSLFLGKRDL